MLNSVVLDVFIGLIFIFVMYSLLATAINEYIATLFAYRHRMLEKAIEQMLDGKSYSYYWWDKLVNITRWLFSSGNINAKISSRSIENKPIGLKKYLSNEPVNDATAATGVRSFTYIKRAKLNKKAALFASRIVNHALYRRKAEHSILFKKPAYLHGETFSDILIDVLTNGKSSSSASPVSMNDIKTFVQNELSNNPGLKGILNLYIEQANGDVQKFRRLLENWYDDTMERVSGWYKRQANKILIVIGFCLAMVFNVSTIAIVGKLSKDKEARESLLQNASEYVKSHYVNDGRLNERPLTPNPNTNPNPIPAGSGDTASNDNTIIGDSTLQAEKPAPNQNADCADGSCDSLRERANRQLQEIKDIYEKSIAQNNSLVALGWNDYGYSEDTLAYKKGNHLKNYAAFRDSMQMNLDSIEANIKDTTAFKTRHQIDNFNRYREEMVALNSAFPDQPSWLDKILFILGRSFSSGKLLLGFLITAFAISLGAPFWFDLLNKFVNLRVSGAKPDAGKNASASKTDILNTGPDPDSVG